MLRNFFGSSIAGGFRTRSVERDRATDNELIGGIVKAIDDALSAFQSEQSGLTRRVEEAVAMASLAVGTDTEEYLSRDAAAEAGLRQFETEMKAGRDRLVVLEQNITHLKFLRAAFATRFPEFGAFSGESKA